VDEVEKTTTLVVTVNVAAVAPAATVTLAGTVAADVLLLETATTAPPAGAGPFKVTVPAEENPPVTVDGFSVSEAGTGGRMVSAAVCVDPKDPEMVAVVKAATAPVATVNVALVAPAGTVTLPATDAAPALLESETTAPPAGAGPFRVAVPVEGDPPVTLVGLKASAESTGGMTVNEAVCVDPKDPEMVAVVEAATAMVATVNVALVAPAGTVTLPGTDAAAALLESETAAPPAGAGAFKVAVPVEGDPPVTLAGLTASAESAGGITVSDAVCDAPLPSVAEIATAVDAATAVVVTVKVALEAPAGTVTLAGTEATAALLLERVTVAPPARAGPLSVTVPVEGLVPVTLAGASASETRAAVGAAEPSAQNSKKLNDQPLPSPTLVVTRRKNLAVTPSGSRPLTTAEVLVRVTSVCQVVPSSEVWIE